MRPGCLAALAGVGVRSYRASDVSEHQKPAMLDQLSENN